MRIFSKSHFINVRWFQTEWIRTKIISKVKRRKREKKEKMDYSNQEKKIKQESTDFLAEQLINKEICSRCNEVISLK